jgi:hypothetical protein
LSNLYVLIKQRRKNERIEDELPLRLAELKEAARTSDRAFYWDPASERSPGVYREDTVDRRRELFGVMDPDAESRKVLSGARRWEYLLQDIEIPKTTLDDAVRPSGLWTHHFDESSNAFPMNSKQQTVELRLYAGDMLCDKKLLRTPK